MDIFTVGEIPLCDATIYIFELRNFDRKLSTSLQKILTLNSEKVRVYKGPEIRNSDEGEFLSNQDSSDA